MEELSIEGKAARYDKAIESLRAAFYDNNSRMCEEYRDACKRIIEPIFPELKESEGEKIRKEIVRFIQMEVEDEIVGNKWLAWLEKQGEKGTNGNEREIPNSEQKPVDKDKPNLLTVERAIKVSPFMRTGFENEPAEWSEDDEGFLNLLLAVFTNEHPNGIFSTGDISVFKGNCVTSNRIIDWLKSLKGRIQPQTKQKWSENDKRKINRIYSILRQAADTHAFSTSCRLIGDKECIELQDFLKSLRPQNKCAYNPYKEVVESIAEMCVHYANSSDLEDFYDNVVVKCKDAKEYDSLFPQNPWKPSDEQIKVCKEVYADILSAKGFDLGTVNSELNRLEEQIKQL